MSLLSEKISLNEIIQALKSLNEISKKEGLEFKFNYRIAKIARIITPLVMSYEKTVQKFFQENGTLDTKTNQYALDPENVKLIEEFRVQNEEALSEMHDVNIELIPLEIVDESLNADQLRGIFWMIQE